MCSHATIPTTISKSVPLAEEMKIESLSPIRSQSFDLLNDAVQPLPASTTVLPGSPGNDITALYSKPTIMPQITTDSGMISKTSSRTLEVSGSMRNSAVSNVHGSSSVLSSYTNTLQTSLNLNLLGSQNPSAYSAFVSSKRDPECSANSSSWMSRWNTVPMTAAAPTFNPFERIAHWSTALIPPTNSMTYMGNPTTSNPFYCYGICNVLRLAVTVKYWLQPGVSTACLKEIKPGNDNLKDGLSLPMTQDLRPAATGTPTLLLTASAPQQAQRRRVIPSCMTAETLVRRGNGTVLATSVGSDGFV